MKIKKLEKMIGNTPMIETSVQDIYAKMEGANPSGSIKDRAAFNMLKEAVENKTVDENTTIIEATSGNTGIGLAFCAKQLGLKIVLTMPESMSVERRQILTNLGAELYLTPSNLGMQGTVDKAVELEKELNGFYARQFENEANPKAHILTTGPEIFKQVPNAKWIVCCVGTGGTAMGIAKYIKQNNIDCKVCAVEPESSPLITKGEAGIHKIQGIGANFIPKIFDKHLIDKIITVCDDNAFENVKWIYRNLNEKVGISSGAAMAAAKKLREETDGDIVVIFPDGGDRYPDSLYNI